MKYTCPVCGYDELRQPPLDYAICPCCGTEFGNTDFEYSHAELRKIWIAEGFQWHSHVVEKPPSWNPKKQILRVLDRLKDVTENHYADTITDNATNTVIFGKSDVNIHHDRLQVDRRILSSSNFATATL